MINTYTPIIEKVLVLDNLFYLLGLLGLTHFGYYPIVSLYKLDSHINKDIYDYFSILCIFSYEKFRYNLFWLTFRAIFKIAIAVT